MLPPFETPSPDGSGWRPTAALVRAGVITVLVVGLALATGRADLVAVGGPIVLAFALAAVERGRGRMPTVTATAPAEVNGGSVLGVEVDVRGPAQAQLVTVAVPTAAGAPVDGRISVGGSTGRHQMWTTAPDWGRVVLARPDATCYGPDCLWEAGPVAGAVVETTVLPVGPVVEELPLPPILGGWAGQHRSRRPGQGGDLVDLREYAPGDRLRSIHWRAFARHQRLFVRRTLSDADADFVLVVDTRSEVQPRTLEQGGYWARWARRWGRRWHRLGDLLLALVRVDTPVSPDRRPAAVTTSMDLSTQAATSIAAAQLGAGDRVGLLDLSSWHRGVRTRAGTRQLQRIRHELAGLRFTPAPGVVRADLWGLPPSAVVVLISPLTDDSVVLAAVDCRARGHLVFVVDILPERSLWEVQGTSAADRTELAVLLAERDLRLDMVRHKNIPIIRWDDGRVAEQLAAIRRTTRDRR